MYESIRPMHMKKGDLIYNNLIGEMGCLQDCHDRGDKAILVFGNKRFAVDKAEQGWSKKILQDGETAAPTEKATGATSNQSAAMFKTQMDESQKNNPKSPIDINGAMQKIKKEVEQQDNPHLPKMDQVVDVEMEHTDNRKEAKSIVKDHMKENKDYYKFYDPYAPGKEYLLKMDDSEDEEDNVDEDDFIDDDEDEEDKLEGEEFADDNYNQSIKEQNIKLQKQEYQSKKMEKEIHSKVPFDPHEIKKSVPKGNIFRVTYHDKPSLTTKNVFFSHKMSGDIKRIHPGQKYSEKQLNKFYESDITHHAVDEKTGYNISHRPAIVTRASAPDPKESSFTPQSHVEYVQGKINEKKQLLDKKHIKKEDAMFASEYVKKAEKHLEGIKGKEIKETPEQSQHREYMQRHNVDVHLYGKEQTKHRDVIKYEDFAIGMGHSRFKEKYGYEPKAGGYAPNYSKKDENKLSVSPAEKEQHQKQLTNVPYTPHASHPPQNAIGGGKKFTQGNRPVYRKYAEPVDQFGVHSRIQPTGISSIGRGDVKGKKQVIPFDHGYHPTELSGKQAHLHIKNFGVGSVEAPVQQIKTQHKEQRALQRIGGGAIEKPKQNTNAVTSAPTEVEKIGLGLKDTTMGISAKDITK